MANLAEVNTSYPVIVQLLLDKELLDSQKLEILREVQAKESSPLEGILVKKGLVSDHDIALAYSEYLLVPLFQQATNAAPLDQALGRLLPEKLCRDQLIAPIAVAG